MEESPPVSQRPQGSSRLLRGLRSGIKYARRAGLASLAAESWQRLCDRAYEAWYGVQTSGEAGLPDQETRVAELISYSPLGYRAIRAALRRVKRRRAPCCFLDYGCGKGRALVVAAAHGCRRVVGVELSEPLSEIARRNLEQMRHRRAELVEIHQMDATQYLVPDDTDLIYFYNPFRGSVLREVLGRIEASYQRRPRAISIIFFNDDDFERAAASLPWIRKVWSGRFHPAISCGLYLTDAPG